MPLPKGLVQPFRRGSLLVGGGWRGWFAPFNNLASFSANNTSVGPNILDLQVSGPFNENLPPSGFFDLGWILKFKITPGSKIGAVRSGFRGAIRAMYRGEVGEQIEFSFRESTRMAWKIATGSQVFNLLSNPNAVASAVGPLNSSGANAISLVGSGYFAAGLGTGLYPNAPTLVVPGGVASGAGLVQGAYLVCDEDYVPGTYGLVGAAGINVFKDAVTDIDFIRKTSDFVNTVVAVVPGAGGGDALILAQPFVGGGAAIAGTKPLYAPSPTAKVQAIKGFAAREGGSFITEWSGLFCMTTIDGSQIALYYPHIAPSQFRDIAGWQLENAGTTDLTGYELDTVMVALAFDDPLDGETVVRYAAYYPAPNLNQIAI